MYICIRILLCVLYIYIWYIYIYGIYLFRYIYIYVYVYIYTRKYLNYKRCRDHPQSFCLPSLQATGPGAPPQPWEFPGALSSPVAGSPEKNSGSEDSPEMG